jgi:hypothetical protein
MTGYLFDVFDRDVVAAAYEGEMFPAEAIAYGHRSAAPE